MIRWNSDNGIHFSPYISDADGGAADDLTEEQEAQIGALGTIDLVWHQEPEELAKNLEAVAAWMRTIPAGVDVDADID